MLVNNQLATNYQLIIASYQLKLQSYKHIIMSYFAWPPTPVSTLASSHRHISTDQWVAPLDYVILGRSLTFLVASTAVIFITFIMKARTKVELLDIPIKQWTKTRPELGRLCLRIAEYSKETGFSLFRCVASLQVTLSVCPYVRIKVKISTYITHINEYRWC